LKIPLDLEFVSDPGGNAVGAPKLSFLRESDASDAHLNGFPPGAAGESGGVQLTGDRQGRARAGGSADGAKPVGHKQGKLAMYLLADGVSQKVGVFDDSDAAACVASEDPKACAAAEAVNDDVCRQLAKMTGYWLGLSDAQCPDELAGRPKPASDAQKKTHFTNLSEWKKSDELAKDSKAKARYWAQATGFDRDFERIISPVCPEIKGVGEISQQPR
jgi:hypothetical protein